MSVLNFNKYPHKHYKLLSVFAHIAGPQDFKYVAFGYFFGSCPLPQKERWFHNPTLFWITVINVENFLLFLIW